MIDPKNYIMIFPMVEDVENFKMLEKYQRIYKVISQIDRRTLEVKFRKGTTASKMFEIARQYAANITC